MAALVRLTVASVLIVPAPAAAQDVAHWEPEIQEASSRLGVPALWIRRVMNVESGGRLRIDGRPITSAAGAMGLMQLMPATWAQMRTRLALGSDPYDPHANILAGTAYLRAMFERFGYPGLFAAYNAGPARLAQVLAGSRALPRETEAYLARTDHGFPMAVISSRSIVRRKTTIFFATSGFAAHSELPDDGLFVLRTP